MDREHITAPETFIPDMGVPYPEYPAERLLKPVYVRNVNVDENFPYIMKSFKEKFMRHLVFAGIYVLVYPMHILRYGLKIEGRENLRKNRKLLKNGAMVVANHVYRWDYLAVLQAVKTHKLWFPTFADNLNTKDAVLIRSVGGIPIPENSFAATKKFNEAFDTLHQKKKWLLLFPESCRWDWYEPLRPFKTGAFTMAYRYNIPVIPVMLHYRPVTGWRKLFGMKHPLVTASIGEPILPDTAKGRKEESRRMCVEAHESMCKMGGIIQNGWDAVLED